VVGRDKISVQLRPAGTSAEQEAFQALLEEVNGWQQVLPGDRRCRPMPFRSHM
jgi:hypothetical protein